MRDPITGRNVVVQDMTYQEWEQGKSNGLTTITQSSTMMSSKEASGFYGDTAHRGVGAKSPTYPEVKNPFTGQHMNFVPGTKPYYPPDHTMAGKGCKTGRQIDDIDRLVEDYKEYDAYASGWQKEKARYQVYDEHEETREVELHWYQHENVGRAEEKIKIKRGSIYVDEW